MFFTRSGWLTRITSAFKNMNTRVDRIALFSHVDKMKKTNSVLDASFVLRAFPKLSPNLSIRGWLSQSDSPVFCLSEDLSYTGKHLFGCDPLVTSLDDTKLLVYGVFDPCGTPVCVRVSAIFAVL